MTNLKLLYLPRWTKLTTIAFRVFKSIYPLKKRVLLIALFNLKIVFRKSRFIELLLL